MSDKGGDVGTRLDEALGALVRQDHGAAGKLFEVLDLLSDLPTIGPMVKAVALAGGWWADDRKPDRVFPALLALKEKIRDAEKKQDQYVHREEFRDLLEDSLRRIANEPDRERRDRLKNILLKVIDEPKDHTENRLLLRLADELSTDAQKILAIVDHPFSQSDRELDDQDAVLATKSGVTKASVNEVKDELVRAGLINRDRFAGPDPSTRKRPMAGNPLETVGGLRFERPDTHGSESYSYFLTRLGRDFLSYSRGP